MGRAKEIVLKVIPASVATPFVKQYHYSGKVMPNSRLHFGVFLDGKMHGVLSYGTSLVKANMLGLVKGSGWYDYLELNRMVFDSVLPRNSESRAISLSIKMIKKYAPHVKWILSFADACSCGDGTIYRASNFVLTDIKENEGLVLLPDGSVIHKLTLESQPTNPRPELSGRSYFDVTGGKFSFKRYLEASGGSLLKGYQLRYIYFIDKSKIKDLAVPIIPFSRIDELGAGMYKGKQITRAARREDCDGQSQRHCTESDTE